MFSPLSSLRSLLKGPEEKIEEICRQSGDERALNRVLVRNEGINVNLLSFQGLSPLHLAALSGHVKVCELLIFGGAHANPTLKTDQNGAMPIHLAAWHGATAVLVLLVERAGVGVDDQSTDGFSALHYACWGGQVSAAKYLLKRGASVAVKNSDGYTPLLLAARCGKIDIVELLLDTTASAVDEGDNQGCTSLHHACWDGHRETVRRLLVAGASVVKADRLGRRPVDLCKTRDIKELVQSVGLKKRGRWRSGAAGGAEAEAAGGNLSTPPPPPPRHLPHTLSSLSSVQAAFSSLSSITAASMEPSSPTLSLSSAAGGASQESPPAGGMLRGCDVPALPVASSSGMARPRVQAFMRMLSGSKDRKTGDAAAGSPSVSPTPASSSSPARRPASQPSGTPEEQSEDCLQRAAGPRSASPPAVPASPHFRSFSPAPAVLWRDADVESEHSEESHHTSAAVHRVLIPPSVVHECWAICAGSGNAKSLYRLLRAYPFLGDAQEGCPISSLRDADGLTPLMRAAQRGFPDVVKLLLIVGCSVSAVDTHGCSALHHASTHGRDTCLSLLLPAAHGGGNKSSKGGSKSSSTPALALVPNSPRTLAYAQTMSSPIVADAAEFPSATTTTTATTTNATATVFSPSSPSSPTNADAPLSLDAQNVNKETALHRAAAHGHLQCVVLLVAAGASLSVPDKLGWTALHHACYRNHTRTVTYLMSRDPQSPLAITRNAETPADLATDPSIKRCLKAQIWFNMIPALQLDQKRAAEKELRRAVTVANNEAAEGSEWDDGAEGGREPERPAVIWRDEGAAVLAPVPVQRRPPVPAPAPDPVPESASASTQLRTPETKARAAADARAPTPTPADVVSPSPTPSKKSALLKILAQLPGTVENAPSTRAGSPKDQASSSASSFSSSAVGVGSRSAARAAAASNSNAHRNGKQVPLSSSTSSSSSTAPPHRVDLTPATAPVDANAVLHALKSRGQRKTAHDAAAPGREESLRGSPSVGVSVPSSAPSAPLAAAAIPPLGTDPPLSVVDTTRGDNGEGEGEGEGEGVATKSSAELISSLRDRFKIKRPATTDAPSATAEAAEAAVVAAAVAVAALTPLQAKLKSLKEKQRAEEALSATDTESDETTSGSQTTAHDAETKILASPGGSPNARSRTHKALALLSRHGGGVEAGLLISGGKATEHDVFLFSLVLNQVFSAYANSVSRSFYRWKHKNLSGSTPGSTRKDGKRASSSSSNNAGGSVASPPIPRVFTFDSY